MSKTLIDKFGPCGLLCEKCFAFANGPIQEHAEQLKANLGEFDVFAKRFVTLLNEPRFEHYDKFNDLLQLFAAGSCQGCRKQACHLFSECNVRLCYREKQVDYCFECSDFPCENTGFDNHLQQRWLQLNHKIREIGLENYYTEVKDKPRY